MRENFEHLGQNCYTPTSGMCFIKCTKYNTNRDYTEEIQDFSGKEKYWSRVLTSARIKPICKKNMISTLIALMERE